MFKRIRHIIPKVTIFALIIISLSNCSKNQNSFLPNVEVHFDISLANYNHLTNPGNSVLFQNEGYKGIIVVCVNPDLGQYYAYDACCPYEKDYSGTVTIQPIKNLTSPPFMVFSSDFFGICKKCGSEFSLLGSGQRSKGPATRPLQSYNVIYGSNRLIVTN